MLLVTLCALHLAASGSLSLLLLSSAAAATAAVVDVCDGDSSNARSALCAQQTIHSGYDSCMTVAEYKLLKLMR
jgi:hypothetical protein